MRFAVTFGQRYAREEHPRLPVAHPDGYLEVLCNDMADARTVAVALLGLAWSNVEAIATEADRAELAQWYPFGPLATIDQRDPELEVIIRAGWAAQAVPTT